MHESILLPYVLVLANIALHAGYIYKCNQHSLCHRIEMTGRTNVQSTREQIRIKYIQSGGCELRFPRPTAREK